MLSLSEEGAGPRGQDWWGSAGWAEGSYRHEVHSSALWFLPRPLVLGSTAYSSSPADSSGVGLECPRAKLAGRDQPALRPTTLHLSSPLYACLASYRTPRAFPCAPYGNHGNYTPCRCQPNCIHGPKENTVVPPHPWKIHNKTPSGCLKSWTVLGLITAELPAFSLIQTWPC